MRSTEGDPFQTFVALIDYTARFGRELTIEKGDQIMGEQFV